MQDDITKLIEQIDSDLDDIEFQLNQTRATVNNLVETIDNDEDDLNV